jgi:hypothetical protein
VLSTKSGRIAVANGYIRDLSRAHITVSLPRRLRLPGSNSLLEQGDLQCEVWRIDKDESVSSFATMRLNLVQLFAENPQNSHLRKLIVDLEAPRFDSGGLLSQDPALSYIQSLPNLNNDQQRSLHKVNLWSLVHYFFSSENSMSLCKAYTMLLSDSSSKRLCAYPRNAWNRQNIYDGACREVIIDERGIYFANLIYQFSYR